MSRVLILGIDGYIGYPLALHLLDNEYEVCGLDNLSRRTLVGLAHSKSLTPIPDFSVRSKFLRSYKNFIDSVATINLSDYYLLERVLREYKPDTIVHLAEQPSAPWSMKGPRQSIDTQVNNVAGTMALLWAMRKSCPNAHLIKLGTMGEYGTPPTDIPEGFIPSQPCAWVKNAEAKAEALPPLTLIPKCPMSGLLFPRSPGSFYHLSKVHDTHNILFACNTWGLRSTDIMQGVVFGIGYEKTADPLRMTRFDYDEYFGTVINRFCAQAAIGHPLTVYGSGNQVRGFLPLKDSIQCLRIAIDYPPKIGEYRTFNQFENIYSIIQLAGYVEDAAEKLNMKIPDTSFIDNPRTEDSHHYYSPRHAKLFELGYMPSTNIQELITEMLEVVCFYQSRINPNCILPTTKWR